MATLATTNPTLADIATRLGPDGKIDPNIVRTVRGVGYAIGSGETSA